MAEKQNIPEIRFEGFTDPWEQRKLGNCGTTYSGLSGKTKEDFGHGNARFVPYTNVYDSPLTDTKRLEAVEIDPSQNKVAYGDVFFTVSSETPDEVGMSSVWLSDQEDVYLNSFCFGYRQDSTFDPHYLAYMLRSSSMRSNLTLLAQGISRFNISKSKVMELSVPVPSAVEQKQIGQYFAELDNLITLHQRKYDKLCTVKKSMLDKMFPKPGETEPEIRFEGFTDPWEQRKLGEVASIKTGPFGSMLHAEDYVDNGTPIVTTEHFKSGFLPDEKAGLPQLSESDRARLEQYSVIEGDILFSRVGSVDVNAQVTAAQSGWLFSGRVLRARPAASVIRPNYLHYELSTDDVKRSVINRAVGGTMASINTEILEDIEIIFPRSAREQSEIGGFLGNLDSLITLHQRKLELLENMKKSLLDKMFV